MGSRGVLQGCFQYIGAAERLKGAGLKGPEA